MYQCLCHCYNSYLVVKKKKKCQFQLILEIKETFWDQFHCLCLQFYRHKLWKYSFCVVITISCQKCNFKAQYFLIMKCFHCWFLKMINSSFFPPWSIAETRVIFMQHLDLGYWSSHKKYHWVLQNDDKVIWARTYCFNTNNTARCKQNGKIQGCMKQETSNIKNIYCKQ